MIIRTGWIPGDLNLSDILTKTTMPANKKNTFIVQLFHNDVEVTKGKDYEIEANS